MPLPDEYLDYLRANTNALERFGDRFTTVDERVDYVVKQLELLRQAGISEQVQELIRNLTGSVEMLLSALQKEGAMFGETTQINFQRTLAPLTGGRFARNCPWDVVVSSITLHFPPGCNALVDVAVGHGNNQICPGEGFIALDDATPVMPFNGFVRAGEEFWTEIRNGDAINPHTISVILTLQRLG